MRIGLVAAGDAAAVRVLDQHPLVDSLWVGGHVSSPNPTPEAMVGLARIAALTERVTVGTAVLLLPLYPPALVAKQVADLDRATGGRIALGVGVGGEYPQEFRALQIPLAERGGRTDEAIRLLRRLWSGEPLSHDGPHFPMTDVRIHPAPVQPGGPPILVGGRKEPAMRRAALHGDGWLPYLYSPERYAASVATVRATAEAVGRDLDGFEWLVWVFVNIADDGEAAREQAARSLGGTYAQDFRAMIDRVAAAGTVDEVTARLVSFHDAGARHFVFSIASGDAPRQTVVDRLLSEVVPELRRYGRPR